MSWHSTSSLCALKTSSVNTVITVTGGGDVSSPRISCTGKITLKRKHRHVGRKIKGIYVRLLCDQKVTHEQKQDQKLNKASKCCEPTFFSPMERLHQIRIWDPPLPVTCWATLGKPFYLLERQSQLSCSSIHETLAQHLNVVNSI